MVRKSDKTPKTSHNMMMDLETEFKLQSISDIVPAQNHQSLAAKQRLTQQDHLD